MSKIYNVHIGMRFTTDVLVEADSIDEATDIASNHLDDFEISDMDFATDDYDTWEVDMNDYISGNILTKDGFRHRTF